MQARQLGRHAAAEVVVVDAVVVVVAAVALLRGPQPPLLCQPRHQVLLQAEREEGGLKIIPL